MTPRQIAGKLYFVAARKKRDDRRQLSIAALAASGDLKAIKQQLKELEKD